MNYSFGSTLYPEYLYAKEEKLADISRMNQVQITQKRGGKRKLTEYELRALSELSHRSPKVVASNLKVLKSKKNKKNLTRALKVSNSKTRRRR